MLARVLKYLNTTPASGLEKYRPRIGLDLHVADGIYQGSRVHCLELFSRVVEVTPECDFFIFLDQPELLGDFSSSFCLPNVHAVRMPHSSAPWRLLWQLPWLCTRYGIDLVHTQYIAPAWSPCRMAVTVHDILFESVPQYFTRKFVLRSRLLVRNSIRRSADVFTVSDFSRDQISTLYGVERELIHRISNGVDHSRFFPGQEGAEIVRQAGLLPGEYFLTVGRIEPRKNHATLLRAWAQLKQPRPQLAVIGDKHFGYEEVLSLRRRLGLEEEVLLIGSVSDHDLPAFFRNCKGFVYCSWAEGFGMPVLEAMASGVPVISSKNTALSEVCGDAALLVDPSDEMAIYHAVHSLSDRPDMRAYLILRGVERAKQFTWREAAMTVRDVYLKSLSKRQ